MRWLLTLTTVGLLTCAWQAYEDAAKVASLTKQVRTLNSRLVEAKRLQQSSLHILNACSMEAQEQRALIAHLRAF